MPGFGDILCGSHLSAELALGDDLPFLLTRRFVRAFYVGMGMRYDGLDLIRSFDVMCQIVCPYSILVGCPRFEGEPGGRDMDVRCLIFSNLPYINPFSRACLGLNPVVKEVVGDVFS